METKYKTFLEFVLMVIALLFFAVGCERKLTKSPEPTHDVAVTDISAPSSCAKGDTVSLTVNIENQGNCSEFIILVIIFKTIAFLT